MDQRPIVLRHEARASGASTYFTGKPCRRGHIELRYVVNAMCAGCLAERRATPEGRAYARSYAQSPAGITARKRHAASEKARARADGYLSSGRSARWSKRHAATGRKRLTVNAWCRRNRAKTAAWWAFYNAQKILATPRWLSSAQKQEILHFYQEARRLALTVDHVIPLRGKTVCGLHVPWNLQLLTQEQNSAKNNRLYDNHAGRATIRWIPTAKSRLI